MKHTVSLLVVAGVSIMALGYYLSPDRSEGAATPVTTSTERAVAATPDAASPTLLARPEELHAPSRTQLQVEPSPSETDGLPAPTPEPEAPRLAPTEFAVVIADQRVRIRVLEDEVGRLKGELDECQNGQFSPLGIARSLPEWAKLDATQHSIVRNFLLRFPVQLSPGEAELIATYTSPDGNTTANLIVMLGRVRVFNAMSPEARDKFKREDAEEFAEYFGTL